MALLRLIDLTASVRTTCQSGLRHKAPALIKKGIQQFVNWAAEDGGYKDLNYIPNITVESVGVMDKQEDITRTMQQRMLALARVHRKFLRLDRSESFWDVGEQRKKRPGLTLAELLVEKYLEPCDEAASDAPSAAGDAVSGDVSIDDMASVVDGDALPSRGEMEPEQDESRIKEESPMLESVQGDPAAASPSMDTHEFRRRPPVVYGLFILRTSVFLLTVDAAKGDDAYVSFHVDMHFMDSHQSVWNALTVALAVCLARDDLMMHMSDFEPADVAEESDPDL